MKKLAIVVAAAAGVAAIAGAQEVAVPPPPGVEEIVVTAQKREQRLLDVGLNVSSFSGETLSKQKIEQIRDVAAFVPNVDIKEQVPGAIPVVTIRGVGLDDFSTTNSPAAGIYVDEVPLSSLALMSFDFYDLDRLEVLKGPQGTLYGRNSTAGAINVLSAKPRDEFEAYAKAGVGSYETYDLEAMVNPVVSSWLKLRFSGKSVHQLKGFWTSRYLEDGSRGERDIGKRDILSGRVQALITPTDWLDIRLKLGGLRQRSELGQPESFGTVCPPPFQPVDPAHCTDLHLYADKDGDPFTGDWTGKFPYNIDQWDPVATVNADLGFAELTSVSGYTRFHRMFHIDSDATPFDQFDFVQHDKVRQFTQELRLASDSRWVGWLVGGFYSWDKINVETPGSHGGLIPFEESLILAEQKTKSAAAFGNTSWHLTDTLDFVAGLRFTWEERDYVGGSTWTVPIPTLIETTFLDDSISDENWSWKLGLEWRALANTLLYANASRGVKSGGFFSGVTTQNAQLRPYEPESLIAYEAGGKTEILDRTLFLGASGFYYDYHDVQTFMRNGSAPVQLIGNVDKARVYGADFDILWRPTESLTLQEGVGILDTHLDSFLGPGGNAVPEGNELPNAPALTYNVLARYEVPLHVWSTHAALQVDAHYADSVFKEATNDPVIRAKPYWIANARLSLFDESERFELAVWGKNLSDTVYVVQGLDVTTFGIGNRNYNAPRTIGGELVYRFG